MNHNNVDNIITPNTQILQLWHAKEKYYLMNQANFIWLYIIDNGYD